MGRLGATWCLWEKYQSTQFQTRDNYSENLQIIYEFGTLEEFAVLWRHTPYSSPSRLFFDVLNNHVNASLTWLGFWAPSALRDDHQRGFYLRREEQNGLTTGTCSRTRS